MKKPQSVFVICAEENYLGIPASKQKCTECLKDIILADSSMENILEHSPNEEVIIYPYCGECGLVKMASINDVQIMPLSRRQIREITEG